MSLDRDAKVTLDRIAASCQAAISDGKAKPPLDACVHEIAEWDYRFDMGATENVSRLIRRLGREMAWLKFNRGHDRMPATGEAQRALDQVVLKIEAAK